MQRGAGKSQGGISDVRLSSVCLLADGRQKKEEEKEKEEEEDEEEEEKEEEMLLALLNMPSLTANDWQMQKGLKTARNFCAGKA